MVTGRTSQATGDGLVAAMRATAIPMVVTDARLVDNPMSWVNPAFSRVTGFSSDESIGRNCRFLQGPDTDPAAVAALRQAVEERRSTSVTLLNYRKDGRTFWNEVSLSPVFDGDGELTHFVGIQRDVSEQIRTEEARQESFRAERAARQDTDRARSETETARQRLGLLAEATTQLASTLDVDETLERLGRLVVPVIADWVSISLIGEHGHIDKVAARHRDGMVDLLARYRRLLPGGITDRALSAQVARHGRPLLVADAGNSDWRSTISSDELVAIVEALQVRSLMHVPLVARDGRVIGSIGFVSGPSGRVFTDDDLSVAADIGRRASITLDNARLYQREHHVAETLQRSLLPDLPVIADLGVAARYRPGDTAADVGGDFYDLLRLPDGSIGLAVGDVVGHDLAAAAAMGHLRGLLHSAAWNAAEEGDGDPARVIDHVGRVVQGLDLPLATLHYGCLVRSPGAPTWRYTYASAGHPPALLRTPGGAVHTLDGSQGLLLGVTETSRPSAATVTLPPGSTLVAFTDGLIERRNDSLQHGYGRIIDALRRPAEDPETLVDRLVYAAGVDGEDDTAVIAIQTPSLRGEIPGRSSEV